MIALCWFLTIGSLVAMLAKLLCVLNRVRPTTHFGYAVAALLATNISFFLLINYLERHGLGLDCSVAALIAATAVMLIVDRRYPARCCRPNT